MPIDYRPGYSRAIEGLVSDSLQMRNERRDKKRAQDEYARQNDLLMRRTQMQDQRDQRRESLDMSDRNQKAFSTLRDLVGQGRLSEAEAFASTTQVVDPRTGQMGGLKFDRGEGPAPQEYQGYEMRAPSEAPKPSMVGKLQLSPEVAAMMPPEQGQPARPKLASVNEAYPRRKPSISTPWGGTVEFDPEEGRVAKEQEAQKRAGEYRQRATREVDPMMAQAWLRAADREESQMSGRETAQLQRIESQAIGQNFKQGEGAKYNTTREDKLKIGMRPRGAGGSPLKTEKAQADLDNKEIGLEGKYDGVVQKVLNNLNYKQINTQAVKLGDIASSIAMSDTNPAAAAAGKGSFVKMAQGGTGVVSDQDMEVFWNRIGGLGMRARDAWQGFVDGTLPPEKKSAVQSALTEMENHARSNLNNIGKAIETGLPSYPGGAERVGRYLQMYAPGYKHDVDRAKAGRGDPAALDSLESEIDARLRKKR